MVEAGLDGGGTASAVGGSDDHSAGTGSGLTFSPIGEPTTVVYAQQLDAEGIVEGVRRGLTVVKLGGPEDPMVELRGPAWPSHSTAEVAVGEVVLLEAEVRGGGDTLVWVRDGEVVAEAEISGDPFTAELEVPVEEATRVRVEVHADGGPRTITSHVFLRLEAAEGGETDLPEEGVEPCGCGTGTALGPWFLLAWLWRRRGRGWASPWAGTARAAPPTSA